MKYINKLKSRLVLLRKTGKCKECVLILAVMALIFAIQYLVIQPAPDPAGSQAEVLGADVTTSDLVNVTPEDSTAFYIVKRVVDGDTFVYMKDGQQTTVRLLGIDTPETKDPRKEVQCFGEEASNEAERLLAGQRIRLVSDSLGDTRDKYGRELRYVYLSDGGLLNAHLVAEGFAVATPEYSFSMKDYFVNLENTAKIAKKGLWNPEICPVK
jgi:micrococcal nuclease